MTEEEKKKIIKDHYRKLGKKGGSSTFRKHGREFMSRIGKMPAKKKTDG